MPSGSIVAGATDLCNKTIQNSGKIQHCILKGELTFNYEIESCKEKIKVLK